jgi:Mg2+-importing ATPase
VIFVIRTWGWAWRSKPDPVLTATSLVTLAVAIAIALSPLGLVVGFVPLSASILGAIAVIACLYLGSAEVIKVLARGLLHRR